MQGWQHNPPHHPGFSTPPKDISLDQILISTTVCVLQCIYILYIPIIISITVGLMVDPQALAGKSTVRFTRHFSSLCLSSMREPVTYYTGFRTVQYYNSLTGSVIKSGVNRDNGPKLVSLGNLIEWRKEAKIQQNYDSGYRGLFSLNPEISSLTERANFKSFYDTGNGIPPQDHHYIDMLGREVIGERLSHKPHRPAFLQLYSQKVYYSILYRLLYYFYIRPKFRREYYGTKYSSALCQHGQRKHPLRQLNRQFQ